MIRLAEFCTQCQILLGVASSLATFLREKLVSERFGERHSGCNCQARELGGGRATGHREPLGRVDNGISESELVVLANYAPGML